MRILFAVVLSYLFGSIPWALIVGKVFYHKDIRKEGSGNLGGTNAGRVLGKKAGISVTLLDGFKAFIAMASSSVMSITSSTRLRSRLSGMKLAPMPWILCGPALPPVSRLLEAGSTATALMSLFFSFRYFAMPLRVPPVPMPAVKAAMVPSVSCHSSGPVVS